MIGEVLIDSFLGTFRLLLGAVEFMSLPVNLIAVLGNILAYGNWIVGLDIMVLFTASVVFWWGVHLSIGLAVWLWRMLPLT